MNATEIDNWLGGIELDVRQSGDARFADQKCTPDVVCFIADCIINLPSSQGPFTVKDIWESRYFMKNVKAIFGKPDADDESAAHEYDKFIQQPMRLLAYAQVLEMTRDGGRNLYEINNAPLLEYIAQRDRNAYIFLYHYFVAVLNASGILPKFERFRDRCLSGKVTQDDYRELRDGFIRFMIGNTRINQAVEVRRIFPKILNVYAVENGINGSRKGHMTEYPFTYGDLSYNTINWRDIGKSKSDTRDTARIERLKKESEERAAWKSRYEIDKTVNLLQRIQTESEVHDRLAGGRPLHAHHIFPKHEFPMIAASIENLIMLTPGQHYTFAHNGKTASINRDYQRTCLLAKSDTIEKSLSRNESYYSKPDFINVINIGLESHLPNNLSFPEIREIIRQLYE